MSLRQERGKPPGERWNSQMRKFCDGIAQGMNQGDAAGYAEYADPASRLMTKPLIKKWLSEREKCVKRPLKAA